MSPCPRLRRSCLALLLTTAACLVVACGDSGTDGTPGPVDPCADGREVTLDSEVLCAARLGTEDTGFACPADMVMYGSGVWAACSPSSAHTDEAVERAVIAGDGLACGAMMIDVLVVVDPSSSMSDEQAALSEGFAAFTDDLAGYGADVRVTVTSMDHGCSVPDVTSAQGVFNQTAATVSSPNDRHQHVVACATDADCAAELGSSVTWVCERPDDDACISNPNGSPNSRCRQVCADDGDCEATLGDGAVCEQFGINAASKGCVAPAPTEGCAVATGPVLEGDDLDQFPCIAVMPKTQLACFGFEQGMRTAWSALDPAGPNSEQAEAFLRPGAMLAVVFITDEEDCSLADGATLTSDQFDRCGQLDDATADGPLWPTAEVRDALVSLKADPAMVKVLAIAGDSLGIDPTEVKGDKADYASSISDPLECYAQTQICSTGTSSAQLGSRWLDLVSDFGDSGVFQNVCSPAGIGAAMHTLLVATGEGWLEACTPSG